MIGFDERGVAFNVGEGFLPVFDDDGNVVLEEDGTPKKGEKVKLLSLMVPLVIELPLPNELANQLSDALKGSDLVIPRIQIAGTGRAGQ